jgi:hypothetical protein
MKLKGWLFTALLAGGVTFAMRGGCVNNSAPDEELADHFEEMCSIASHNIDSPKKGVQKLGRYMGRHLDDILSDFGATIVTIEKIDDDRKHDERARLARDRMQKPWRSCQRDWERFWNAVEGDQEAAELVNRTGERLGRTFDIIFSSKDGVDLKTLPDHIINAI